MIKRELLLYLQWSLFIFNEIWSSMFKYWKNKKASTEEEIKYCHRQFFFSSEKHLFSSCSGNITQLFFSFSSPVLSLYHSTWLWVGSKCGSNQPSWPYHMPDLTNHSAWLPLSAFVPAKGMSTWLGQYEPFSGILYKTGRKRDALCFLYFKM